MLLNAVLLICKYCKSVNVENNINVNFVIYYLVLYEIYLRCLLILIFRLLMLLDVLHHWQLLLYLFMVRLQSVLSIVLYHFKLYKNLVFPWVSNL